MWIRFKRNIGHAFNEMRQHDATVGIFAILFTILIFFIQDCAGASQWRKSIDALERSTTQLSGDLLAVTKVQQEAVHKLTGLTENVEDLYKKMGAFVGQFKQSADSLNSSLSRVNTNLDSMRANLIAQVLKLDTIVNTTDTIIISLENTYQKIDAITKKMEKVVDNTRVAADALARGYIELVFAESEYQEKFQSFFRRDPVKERRNRRSFITSEAHKTSTQDIEPHKSTQHEDSAQYLWLTIELDPGSLNPSDWRLELKFPEEWGQNIEVQYINGSDNQDWSDVVYLDIGNDIRFDFENLHDLKIKLGFRGITTLKGMFTEAKGSDSQYSEKYFSFADNMTKSSQPLPVNYQHFDTVKTAYIDVYTHRFEYTFKSKTGETPVKRDLHLVHFDTKDTTHTVNADSIHVKFLDYHFNGKQ